MLTYDDVKAAAARIGGRVRRTPVLELLPNELGLTGATATVLKLEGLQRIGAFKARGAFNFLLGADIPAVGVVAASGGNHAAAVALAAHDLNCRARLYVPATAPRTKLDKIRELGAEVVRTGGAIGPG